MQLTQLVSDYFTQFLQILPFISLLSLALLFQSSIKIPKAARSIIVLQYCREVTFYTRLQPIKFLVLSND